MWLSLTTNERCVKDLGNSRWRSLITNERNVLKLGNPSGGNGRRPFRVSRQKVSKQVCLGGGDEPGG